MKSIANLTSSGGTRVGLPAGTPVRLGAPGTTELPRLTVSSAGVVQRAGQPFRTAGANIFQLVNNDYPDKAGRLMTHAEIDSLLDRAVTLKLGVVRALTLGQNIGSTSAHLVAGITGTTNPVITYRPAVWEVMDYAIKAATDRGLYLVTTLTGEPGSYHGSKRDWVNFRRPGTCSTDLSVNSAGSETEKAAESYFYSDTQIGVTDFRTYTRDILTHVNVYTGRAYKDEPALCLQSGNEMWTADSYRTWQTSWADYVKTIAPDTLILDGMGADLSSYWATQPGGDALEHIITAEALANQSIRVHTLHPYSVATAADVTEAARRCALAGKALAVDEYGWSKANAADIEAAVRASPNAFFSAWWSLQNDADLHNGGPGVGYGTDDASLYVPGKDATQTTAITRLLAHSSAMTAAAASAGAPDLVVTSLSSSPTNPAAGAAVTFSGVVKNQGTAATPAGTVVGLAFSIDGGLVAWSDTSSTSLAAGASRTLTANGGPLGVATWTATAGAHALSATVDDVNRITGELDETNNTSATSTLTVTGSATPVAAVTGARSMVVPASDPLVSDWTDDAVDAQSLTMHANYASEDDVTNIVAPALRDSGVRHWRDGFGNNAASIRKVQSIASIAVGTRGCVTVDTRDGNNPGNVVAYLTALGGDANLWAAEGLNEWDIHSELRDDQGQGFPNPDYANRLYAAIKTARDAGNTAIDGILVGTPTMANPLNSSTLGPVSADVTMHHPYQGGALPMDQMTSKWIPNADRLERTSGTGTRPLFSSETGYHLVDTMAGQNGITMNAARKYIPRLFLGYRRLSRLNQRWIAPSLYNLSTDQWSLLLTSTGARTAAFNALASLNTLLADRGTRPTPQSVAGVDTGGVADVQFHVMGKRDGSLWVAAWRETASCIPNNNAATRQDITVARVPVTVTLPSSRAGVVYRPSTTGTAAQETTSTGTTHTVQVGDEATLVRLA